MTDPDAALIEATGRGDITAFELLVKRYQGSLLNFITRYLGDRTAAEDVAQEVFVRIYRAASRFEPKTRASTWIFRIAYRLVLTELDRRRRRQNLCDVLDRRGKDDAQEPLTDPLERLELEEEILAALSRLPDHQRAALLLRVYEELSYQEISEVLGVSIQSVESLLFRARKNMRQMLGRKQNRE